MNTNYSGRDAQLSCYTIPEQNPTFRECIVYGRSQHSRAFSILTNDYLIANRRQKTAAPRKPDSIQRVYPIYRRGKPL